MAHQKNPLDKIIAAYPHFPDKEIAAKFKVKLSYVRNIGGRYGLKKLARPWSAKETKILLKFYDRGMAGLVGLLPNRSKWAMINKYRELKGLRPSVK